MKNLIKIFTFPMLVFLLFSCSKDDNPTIAIYVSAKKSDLYQSISMNHGRIEMITGESGGPLIQNYDGLDVNLDLSSDDNSVLVGEVRFGYGMYTGLSVELQEIDITRIEGTKLDPLFHYTLPTEKLGQEFELVKNAQYRLDFIYDVDKSIRVLDPEYEFNPVVEIKITQL